MPNAVKLLLAASLAIAAAPALAQDEATSEAPAEDAPAEDAPAEPESEAPAPETDGPGLSMGEPAEGEGGVGSTYVDQEHGDWQQRCVRTEDGNDPCQLYQLLQDNEGNSVAEISVAPLPEGAEAAAGATVITPLETLLTAQLQLSVDGGEVRRYPFSWCSAVGCFSRIGFTEGELNEFRNGAEALIEIRPVAAPEQTVELPVSLMGFTAGFEAVDENNSEATGE